LRHDLRRLRRIGERDQRAPGLAMLAFSKAMRASESSGRNAGRLASGESRKAS
jgi:hypothetical protein